MNLKGVKPSADVEDRRGDPQPQGPIERQMAGKAISDREERRKKKFSDNMRAELGKRSKNGGEYGARTAEFDKNVRKVESEAAESDADAVRAWEDANNRPSKKLKRAMKEISGVTKGFDNKKFRSATPPPKPKLKPEGYAGGGAVRGFGKARGAKPIKVC